MAELPEFALRVIAVAQRAARVELGGRALKLRDGAVALAGVGKRAARDCSGQRCLDWGLDLVGGDGRRQREFGRASRVAVFQGDGRKRPGRPRQQREAAARLQLSRRRSQPHTSPPLAVQERASGASAGQGSRPASRRG
jgi:hypothetical protein